MGLMFCSAVLAAVAVFCTAARLPELHAGDAALAAAGFILPGGAAEAFRTELSEDVAASAPESSSQAPSSSSKPAASSSSKRSLLRVVGDRQRNGHRDSPGDEHQQFRHTV